MERMPEENGPGREIDGNCCREETAIQRAEEQCDRGCQENLRREAGRTQMDRSRLFWLPRAFKCEVRPHRRPHLRLRLGQENSHRYHENCRTERLRGPARHRRLALAEESWGQRERL